ncbi:MAG TPA: DUF5938 domain-containing protein [Roseiarcus sp.]|nr:DUF5938 domain-containing protein [Roseiarcus sp.]
MEISLGAQRSDRSFCVPPSLSPCCGKHPWRQRFPRGSGIFAAPQFPIFSTSGNGRELEEQIKPLPPDEQQAKLAGIAASIQAGMPPRENPRVNISLDSVYGSGPLARVHCVIHGVSNYKQTGLLQAYAAYSLLQSPPKRAGFASACQAFGHRELLGVLKSFGLVMDPMLTAHR